jgi:hypothetical protein
MPDGVANPVRHSTPDVETHTSLERISNDLRGIGHPAGLMLVSSNKDYKKWQQNWFLNYVTL